MLDFNQQKSRYLWLIEVLQNYKLEGSFTAKIAEWNEQNGVVGFPSKYSLCIEYKDIPKSNMDLIFYLDQDGNWSKVEILNINVAEMYRHQGFGRGLINQAINIAKVVGTKRICGDALKKNGYSSVGFYKKCGFDISEDSKPRKFYMENIQNN